MKTIRVVLASLLLLTTTSVLSETTAQRSFEQLKTLNGSWEGTNSKGAPLRVSFRDTSKGTALLLEVHGAAENMVSMFHLDGSNRLMMTHYCSAGNQPRLSASPSPDGKTITFNFFDATNLAEPEAGHMQRVIIAVLEPNHHLESWIFTDHGKEMTETYDLHRSEIAPSNR